MKIKVEQKHINAGIRRKPCLCPVALAFKDATGLSLSVSGRQVRVVPREDSNAGLHQPSPEGVLEFVRDFDSGCKVEPFEFEFEDVHGVFELEKENG